jgi:hypothetical protein
MTRGAILSLIFLMSSSAQVKIDKAAYAGWPNCYRIANTEVELIVTGDVGPRVIRYGFLGGQNLFKEFKDQMGKSGEKVWTPRGGHRIWFAPEDVKDTYALDNSPVKIDVKGDTVTMTQAVEPETGFEKQIIVRLAAKGSAVEVTHRIRNTRKAREIAPWALTMMAQGGMGIHGFPPRGTHPEVLAPTNPLVMWAFTDLADPRWKFTRKYLMLRQDPNNAVPQKLGTFNLHTFGAYLLGSDLFIKRYQAEPGKPYPDFGSCYETFTNADFLELETLGPLRVLKPGETATHVERWSLHRNVNIASWTDAEIDRAILPLLK